MSPLGVALWTVLFACLLLRLGTSVRIHLSNRRIDRAAVSDASRAGRREWESESARMEREALEALTPADVADLVSLGWDSPIPHHRRVVGGGAKPGPGDEVMTRIGPVTLGVRAATPDELRFDPYADGTLKRPMSLVSRDGAC